MFNSNGKYGKMDCSRLYVYPHLKEAAIKMRKKPTPAEARVWSCLKGKMLGEAFLRQYVIDTFIVDFCCPKLKLVIEIDGPIHTLPEKVAMDAVRQKHIIDLGYKIIRFSNSEIFENIRSVKSAIRSVLKERN